MFCTLTICHCHHIPQSQWIDLSQQTDQWRQTGQFEAMQEDQLEALQKQSFFQVVWSVVRPLKTAVGLAVEANEGANTGANALSDCQHGL